MVKVNTTKKKFVFVIPLVFSLVVVVGTIALQGPTKAFASESNAKRYSDGYQNGYDWYANHPTDGASNCDPNSLYTSGGGHTQTYCNGWSDGYTAASNNNSGNVNTGQQQSSDVNIKGDNNRVTVNQGQSQGNNNEGGGGSSDGHSHDGSSGLQPRCLVLCSIIK